MTDRLEALRRDTHTAALDGLFVMPGPNLVHLTGVTFHLSERPVIAVVPVDAGPALVIPELERTKAERLGRPWQLQSYGDPDGPQRAVAAAMAHSAPGGGRFGIESRRLRYLEWNLISQCSPSLALVAADAVFARQRLCKETTELAAIRRAVAIAQDALRATLPAVRPGASEKAIASELVAQLLAAGSEPSLPFWPIVASGPNGAMPHAFPTDRRLGVGDLVTIDWGATFDGYASDITRTYALAAPPQEKLARAYEAVRSANAAGIAAVRPGRAAEEVDRAARAAINDAGLGVYFVHRTGHGLGLEAHEEPEIKEGSRIGLEPGMTFTVEPGVYLPDVGGVRIEDDVVVTEDGVECLTDLPREQIVLG